MEGLAAAGGVFAVVGLAGQVLQGCAYLRSVFENAENAPTEVRLLTMELIIIESIISAASRNNDNQDALDFCNEAVAKLRKVVDKYGVLDGVSRCRKWGTRLAMALSSDKIVKHLGRLREAKGYLQQVEATSIQNQCVSTTNKVLQSVNHLSTSHSETAMIISRAEGKIDELKDINQNTYLILNELASRVVARENQAMIQDNRTLGRMKSAVDEILSDVLTKHLKRLTFSDVQHGTKSDSIPAHAFKSLDQNTTPGPSTIVCKDFEGNPIQRRQLSIIERRISEFAATGSQLNDTEEYDDEKWEKSSKFSTRLGEVFMKTTYSTYSSKAKLLLVTSPDSWGESSSITEFPVTITRTDILLLPRNWGRKMGASIWCQQISSPSSFNSDFLLQIERDIDVSVETNPEEGSFSECQAGFRATVTPRSGLRRSKIQRPSLILRFAFEVAFMGQNLLQPNKNSSSGFLTAWSHPHRNSFDDEVNNALELVHLWKSSGFDNAFYRAAFPHKKVRSRDEWKAVVAAKDKGHPVLQKLRLEYTRYLVIQMIASHKTPCSTGPKGGESYLNDIHEIYWGKFHLILSLSALSATNHLLGAIFRLSPAFEATRSSDIQRLKLIFSEKKASPGDRDHYGETILHEAFGVAVMSIEDWWYHNILSNRLRRASFRPSKSRRLRLYRHICAKHEVHIDELFETIRFLLLIGLRMPETREEYHARWGYLCCREHATWKIDFPWNMDGLIISEDYSLSSRLQASIRTLDSFLLSACEQSDLDTHDTLVSCKHSNFTPASWLPYPLRHGKQRYWSKGLKRPWSTLSFSSAQTIKTVLDLSTTALSHEA